MLNNSEDSLVSVVSANWRIPLLVLKYSCILEFCEAEFQWDICQRTADKEGYDGIRKFDSLLNM